MATPLDIFRQIQEFTWFVKTIKLMIKLPNGASSPPTMRVLVVLVMPQRAGRTPRGAGRGGEGIGLGRLVTGRTGAGGLGRTGGRVVVEMTAGSGLTGQQTLG